MFVLLALNLAKKQAHFNDIHQDKQLKTHKSKLKPFHFLFRIVTRYHKTIKSVLIELDFDCI